MDKVKVELVLYIYDMQNNTNLNGHINVKMKGNVHYLIIVCYYSYAWQLYKLSHEWCCFERNFYKQDAG